MAKRQSFAKKFINYKLPREFWVPKRLDTLIAFAKTITTKNPKTISKTIPKVINQLKAEGKAPGEITNVIVQMTPGFGTITSPNTMKAKQILSMSSVFDNVKGGYSTRPVIKNFEFDMTLYAATPFMGMFFLALQENGEVITNSETINSDMFALADTACGTQDHTITPIATVYVKMAESPYITGGNNYFYRAQVHFSIDAKTLQEYFTSCSQKEIEEEIPLALNLGFVWHGTHSLELFGTGFMQYTVVQEARLASEALLGTL